MQTILQTKLLMKKLLFPAIIESVSSRKDKTLAIKVGSNEMSPDKAALIMSMNQEAVFVYIKANDIQDDETKMVDGLEADLYDSQKSQSKRIRSVLYLLWKKENEGFEEFKSYYKNKTEKYIDFIKSKLD